MHDESKREEGQERSSALSKLTSDGQIYTLEQAGPRDAQALLEIYAPYVKNTAITFECRVPSVPDFERRISTIGGFYPYLKLMDPQGRIQGYAYLCAFHPREAYRYCAETCIYLSPKVQGLGLGSMMYERLERCALKMNLIKLYSCIAVLNAGETGDPYLANTSYEFHLKAGYFECGRFEKCGYKFGRWYSMVWMQKDLKTQEGEPGQLLPFSQVLKQEKIRAGL